MLKVLFRHYSLFYRRSVKVGAPQPIEVVRWILTCSNAVYHLPANALTSKTREVVWGYGEIRVNVTESILSCNHVHTTVEDIEPCLIKDHSVWSTFLCKNVEANVSSTCVVSLQMGHNKIFDSGVVHRVDGKKVSLRICWHTRHGSIHNGDACLSNMAQQITCIKVIKRSSNCFKWLWSHPLDLVELASNIYKTILYHGESSACVVIYNGP